jgi:hypothetical protein
MQDLITCNLHNDTLNTKNIKFSASIAKRNEEVVQKIWTKKVSLLSIMQGPLGELYIM